mgnify:CR=1 FL=1
MGILSNLEPKRVFEIFEEMCAIPHGSANTKAISDWCVAFGEKLGLEHYQDEANNVILIAPATPGYEDAPAVILQGHVDMVCEKEAGCAKDMDKEGLDLFVDGDLVGAKGTTLGGDDGIAVAMALAALEDTTLQHPRLEVVLTTDEEIGMLGAAVLDVTPLQGRTMLNIDSEEEGIFTVVCAGGSSVFCHLPLIRENFSGETLEVRVSGLVGGHSGVEINKGRANADVLLGRLLRAMAAVTELRLVSAEGGSKDNAIPTAAVAVHLSQGGTAVGVGKYAEHQKAVELAPDWDIWFRGKRLLDAVWPVGSIYLSASEISPETLFGGTWQRVKDRFLLAAGDVYAPGETGGEAQHTLTKAEMPAHTHGYDFTGQSDVTGVTAIRLYDADGRRNEYQGASASAGGGAAHNNMPPYLAVYVWKRTA